MKAISDFTKMAEQFYAISDQMPVSYILTLLWVGLNPDGNQLDLEKFLGSSNATCSRAVKYWSKWKSPRQGGTKGVDYIDIYQDPNDRRYNRLKLTEAGQVFLQNIMKSTA